MLTIRQDSVDAVQSARIEAANRRLVEYAQERFPSVFKPANAARSLKLVEEVRARASAYGITREDNVATMLDLVTMYGLAFDQAPWAAGVLSNPKLHGPDKISLLKRRVRQQDINL